MTVEPEPLAFYQLEAEDRTAVQLVAEDVEVFTFREVLTGERFPLNRAPFMKRLNEGYVDRVYPRWVLTPPDSVERRPA